MVCKLQTRLAHRNRRRSSSAPTPKVLNACHHASSAAMTAGSCSAAGPMAPSASSGLVRSAHAHVAQLDRASASAAEIAESDPASHTGTGVSRSVKAIRQLGAPSRSVRYPVVTHSPRPVVGPSLGKRLILARCGNKQVASRVVCLTCLQVRGIT